MLGKLPVLQVSARERDAGVFLNKRLAWNSNEVGLQKYLPKKPSFGLSRELKARLRTKDWLDQKIDLSKLDTSWFDQLGDYDHWDLYKSGPLPKWSTAHPEVPPVSMPFPDSSTLTAWSKVCLLRGIHERKVLPALKEARQLARLSYTLENLAGEMLAVGVLRQELETYQYAVSHSLLSPDQWQPI